MTRTRIIALTAGAITTLIVFVAAMWLLVFGGLFPEKHRLILVSIALGPVAMVSVMVGYAVWWLVMFVLSLFSPTGQSSREYGDQDRE